MFRKALTFIREYWPTMIVVGVILYATLLPHPIDEDDIPPIPYIDKLIHAVMMGGLLSAIAFDWQRAHRNLRLTPSFVWALFIAVIAFSIFDELLQGAIDNGRDAEAYDFLADCIGAIAAVYLAPPAIRVVLGLHRKQQEEALPRRPQLSVRRRERLD